MYISEPRCTFLVTIIDGQQSLSRKWNTKMSLVLLTGYFHKWSLTENTPLKNVLFLVVIAVLITWTHHNCEQSTLCWRNQSCDTNYTNRVPRQHFGKKIKTSLTKYTLLLLICIPLSKKSDLHNNSTKKHISCFKNQATGLHVIMEVWAEPSSSRTFSDVYVPYRL